MPETLDAAEAVKQGSGQQFEVLQPGPGDGQRRLVEMGEGPYLGRIKGQIHGCWLPLGRLIGEHATDLRQPLVEFCAKGCQVGQQTRQIQGFQLGETLMPALHRFGQFLRLAPVTPPLLPHFPDFVGVRLRRIQELAKPGLSLDLPGPQGLRFSCVPLTAHQIQVGPVKLFLGRPQFACGGLEVGAAGDRPDKDRNQAVDQDAQSGLLGTQHRGLEGLF